MTDERYGDVATTFSLTTGRFNDGPEAWRVRVVSWPEDGEPNEDDVLAEAIVYRAFVDQNWFDRFDSVDQGLASVAEDLIDRDRIESIDEESAFAQAISIVYSVTVREDARGRRLSHELVRSLTRVFGNDIIALMPSRASWDAGGEIVEDQFKHRALLTHWRGMGFVSIPGADSLLLPLSERQAELEG
ncbi:hypothetical protein [Microbacterium sp. NPDC056234]|uniref:hypothetical protein n=1 Tax=Microbacterium sp. NPDC056234 TaxID=3345757 RepID=UPI0035D780BD